VSCKTKNSRMADGKSSGESMKAAVSGGYSLWDYITTGNSLNTINGAYF